MKHLRKFTLNETKLTQIYDPTEFYEKYRTDILYYTEIAEIIKLFISKCLYMNWAPNSYKIVLQVKNPSKNKSIPDKSIPWKKTKNDQLFDFISQLKQKYDTIFFSRKHEDAEDSEGFFVTKGLDEYYLVGWFCPWDDDMYICDEFDSVRSYFEA